MAMEIYPQSITLYPSDKQALTVRQTSFEPVTWGAVDACALQSDGSLYQDTTSTSFSGVVAPVLHQGSGSMEWTLDANMLPGSGGGQVAVEMFSLTSSTYGMLILIGQTSTVTKNKAGTTLDTVSHTAAAGDVYKVEIFGQFFRLFINGTQVSSYTEANPIEYPVRGKIYGSYGNTAMAVSRGTLQPPTLTGDWTIDPTDTVPGTGTNAAWTGAGGTLSASNDTYQVTYTAGLVPGTYTPTVTLAGSAYQVAESDVTIEALQVLNGNALTVQPSASIFLRTNYDKAQTALVTWSVVSGSGTLTSNKFTAPATAGTTVLKAVSGVQVVKVTITIPITFTAATSGGSSTTAATPSGTLTLTTSMSGTPTWTAQCGSLSGSGSTRTWTAPSTANLTCRITVTNGTDTKILTLETRDAIPYTPSLNQTVEYKKKVIVSEAEDGTITGRQKTPTGKYPLAAELLFRTRPLAEFEAMLSFFNSHHPGTPVIFDDLIRGTRHVVYFDSDVKGEFFTSGDIDYTFRIRERVAV